jgi:HEAT repeat protein
MTDVARMRFAGDVDGLCHTVLHGDGSDAARAAALLGDMGDDRAVDTLLDAVRQHDERCRAESHDDDRLWPLREAVAALGRLRARRAVPLLCRLLDGKTALTGPPLLWVERATLRALVDIGAPEAVDLLLARIAENPDNQLIGLLGELGEPAAVVPLLAQLWSLLRFHGEDAVRALGELRDARAAPALLHLAATGSSLGLRRAALTALTGLPGASWDTSRSYGRAEDTQLKPLLGDPDRELADLAAELLTRSGYGRHTLRNAVYNTARRFSSHSETACVAACAVISRQPDLFADDQLLPPELITLLGRTWPRPVRRAAAEALGALGDRDAVGELLNALGDNRIADAVAEVIGRLPEPPVRQLVAMLRRGNPAAATALGLAGHADAGPRLLDAIAPAGSLALRAAAVDALGRLGHRPAVDPLAALVVDEVEPSSLQARAVRALGLIGDPGSVPVLLDASRAAAESVRLRAAAALGGYPAPEVITRLGEMADEEGLVITLAAITSLGQAGKPAVPTLSALVDRAPEWPLPTQRALVTALGGCAGPEPVHALGRLSVRPFAAETRTIAATCLSERHEPACEAHLLRFLDDPSTELSHGVALRGLALIGSTSAVDRVVGYFRERRYFRHPDEVLEALAIIAAAHGPRT